MVAHGCGLMNQKYLLKGPEINLIWWIAPFELVNGCEHWAVGTTWNWTR